MSIIGFLKTIGKDKITEELVELRSFKFQAKQIIEDLDLKLIIILKWKIKLNILNN